LYPEPFDAPFAKSIYEARYKKDDDHNWAGTSKRVIGSVTGALYEAPKAQSAVAYIGGLHDRLYESMTRREFIPGGRYLYAAGRDMHQVCNCILLRAEDSREGWAELTYKSAMALMTGAGIGVWYGDIRAAGSPIRRTGGTASGPLPLAELVNDQGRCYLQGGNRRSAIWAGFPWWHPDIFDFIGCKDWSDSIKAEKEKDWNFRAPMDTTNISVTLDDFFFAAYSFRKGLAGDTAGFQCGAKGEHGFMAPDGGTWADWAERVYESALSHMLKHGEPGFTVDVRDHAGEVLRNACTEITSADDSDVCNLGSLVLSRFDSPAAFGAAVRDSVMFLTAGSMYSHMPYEKVGEIREQNRRLGLGLIGVHEFLLKHGVRYGTDEAFEVMEPYMKEYGRALEYANEQQHALGISASVGGTAIAPNGTIGIIAESTPSGDPLFSAAERRNVVVASPHGNRHESHIVIDPTAARLVREGIDPDLIEDAHSLSLMPERRLAQQAFMQDYTDHAISSTVNLAAPIVEPSEVADFGNTLMEFLPRLRGITAYPDGARAGQPRTPVDLKWALANEGAVYETEEETCVGGACGV
jgi:ribonucleoside-diphosphate reductase alpha chain